tara:strand:- start:771 stop:2990 length:2220 start_codon:yes stop_codon:yes gene_type:complete
MYKQNLYKIIEPIRINTIKRLNKSKKWKYGYDKEHDIIVISKTGQIGEIYEIQNLKIALPKQSNVYKRSNNKKEQHWEQFEYPKALKNVKTIFDWRDYPNEHKDKWFDYIDEEFDRRENGFWFNNNGVPTYITGTHYMYLQWSKIDVGAPEFRESNRLFYLFWEACKADKRCYGICYLKNRRSGFSFMASSETVNAATISSDARFGILSKSGWDAKKMFTDKVVPISVNYPFFFKPIQDGMDRPKSELAYRVPAQKFTRKKLQTNEQLEEIVGLDTTIDWKNTGDNSYDGEKLNLLVHDESGKWERPDNILNNWRVTKTCLRLGSRIIGKCMMGSTSNSLDKGGDNFKRLYRDSNVTKRNKNGQTKSGLYSLFIPMEWNYEGFMDRYGIPLFNTPENPVQDIHGDYIDIGVVDHWENEVEGLKNDQDALNEFYRQFPRTEEHAFRDETQNSIFNLAKIYEQIDFNDDINNPGISKGNFQWVNGVKDSKVIFYPDPKGRFNISWTPDPHLQNNIIIKNGIKYPGNEHMGAFGCDSYDISGTVDGQGSKGSLHGLTKFSMENTPPSMFFLEYIARPATSEIFFEDMLMALVFYGMPLLAENNKPRLLYYLRRRGYRGYSMNRPDKVWNKLSTTEKEIGGIPNSSEDIKQAHAAAIEMYIQNYVGLKQDNTYGDMYFNKTLNDWAKFDINKRTKFDATISSGLAIMACNRHLYAPNVKIKKEKVNINIMKYNNHGVSSKLIK